MGARFRYGAHGQSQGWKEYERIPGAEQPKRCGEGCGIWPGGEQVGVDFSCHAVRAQEVALRIDDHKSRAGEVYLTLRFRGADAKPL